MSRLFLINQTIDLPDLNEFKEGMMQLLLIDKDVNHIFHKHQSIYHLGVLGLLYATYGQEEQEISRFIEQQLAPVDSYIETELDANNYCNSTFNAFLGIDFSVTAISPIKRVVDDGAYKAWIKSNNSPFENFKDEFNQCVHDNNFEKDFDALSGDVQEAIIGKVQFCKSRGLQTPLAPGTQLIKDVTQDNFKFSLMEFRISSPVGLRIYFKEQNNITYMASIELKSNADQTTDIKKAYKILVKLLP